MPGAGHDFTRSSAQAQPRLKRIAFWICVTTASLCPAITSAESRPNWFGRSFHYVVINQDVRGILTEFGRNVGVPVILSDKIGGRVRGEVVARTKNTSQAPTAGEFLNQLAEANALTWYFDGSILYLSADQEFSTQLIEVGTLSPQAIVTELKRLSLLDERFSVRSAGNAGLITVSGPPAFIAIVRQVVDKMRPPPAVAGDDPRVRVFRGGAPAEVVRAGTASTSPQDGVGQRERQIEATRDPNRQR
jgi:type II secretory pathway component GspD/PulD (secretin)